MRPTWSIGLAAAVLTAGGCATEQPGDGSWTPPGNPGPVDRSRPCLAAQSNEAFTVSSRLQRIVTDVLEHPDEPQQSAVWRVRALIHQTDRRVARKCDEHTDLAPLLEVVDSRVGDARGALDEPTLRLVVATFRDWARRVDAADRATLYYHRDPCVPFRRGVDVSVEVEREPAAARVVLVVENRLGQRIYVDHGGRIRVEGTPPDGAERTLDWGGSSSDTAAARAGHTSRTPVWPAGLRDPDIPLLPGGSLEIFDEYAVAYSQLTCRVPVRLPDEA